MHEQPSLLSQLKDQEPLDPEQHTLNRSPSPPLRETRQHPHQQLLNLQPPSLLTRMCSPATLQGLPLSQSQGPTTTYSSNVMPLSKRTARGRSPSWQHMLRSNSNSSKRSEMTEQELMPCLGRSLQRSRATIQRLERQSRKGERSSCHSAPPALLFRIQMGTDQTKSWSPKGPKLTSQRTHGSQVERINEPSCETLLQRLSSSSKFTPSTPRQQNVPSSMNRTAQSSQTQNGKTSFPV